MKLFQFPAVKYRSEFPAVRTDTDSIFFLKKRLIKSGRAYVPTKHYWHWNTFVGENFPKKERSSGKFKLFWGHSTINAYYKEMLHLLCFVIKNWLKNRCGSHSVKIRMLRVTVQTARAAWFSCKVRQTIIIGLPFE